MMKRLLALVAVAVACSSAAAQARVVLDSNGRPFPCPDPSVLRGPDIGAYAYHMVCTTDYESNAFAIRGSNDLVHWQLQGYVFPAGHQPWWAVHSTGHWPGGRYWAPDLHYIRGRWVVYFAAQVDLSRVTLHPGSGDRVSTGTFAVGVAWSKNLFGGWHTKILHYRGEVNRWNSQQEVYGGVIDPGEVRDPRSGQRWLFWAEQPASVWSAKLSPDGLDLDRTIHMVLWVWNPGWDCSPLDGHCTVEGPAPFFYDNRFYLFFSGASTWNSTYAMGAAVSRNAASTFQRLPGPILRKGRVWIGPGGGQVPVQAPNGSWWMFYHALRSPSHLSESRMLLVGRVRWVIPHTTGEKPSWLAESPVPLVGGGLAGARDASAGAQEP